MASDDHLPQLIHRSGNQMTVRFNREAKKFGINAQTWRVLASLLEADGQKVGMLAETTSVELSTLSHLLTRMGQNGLVKRKRMGEDHRSVTLTLTPAGRALAEKIAPLAARNEEQALDGFDEEEARVLKSLLKRVVENVEAMNDGGETRH